MSAKRVTRHRTWMFGGCVVLLAACSNNESAAKVDHTKTAESHDMAAQMAPAEPTAQMAPAEPAAQNATLTRVADPSQVCMVNNQFMGKPQIPVEVEGRTYFGCCEMCKGKLTSDPSSRRATDPVTKREVDKSRAVIAQLSTGSVLYFENEANFAAYAAGPSPTP